MKRENDKAFPYNLHVLDANPWPMISLHIFFLDTRLCRCLHWRLVRAPGIDPGLTQTHPWALPPGHRPICISLHIPLEGVDCQWVAPTASEVSLWENQIKICLCEIMILKTYTNIFTKYFLKTWKIDLGKLHKRCIIKLLWNIFYTGYPKHWGATWMSLSLPVAMILSQGQSRSMVLICGVSADMAETSHAWMVGAGTETHGVRARVVAGWQCGGDNGEQVDAKCGAGGGGGGRGEENPVAWQRHPCRVWWGGEGNTIFDGDLWRVVSRFETS
jgi:hypothetical protein